MRPRLIILAILAALLAAGCGSEGDGARSGTVTLKLADTVPATDPFAEAEQRFAQRVEEATGGRIKIETYPGGQLGSDLAMAQGVKLGTVDMAVSGTTTSKVTDAFYLPYLFKDAQHQRRVMDGPIGARIRERFRKDAGMVMAGEAYFSTRHVSASRPVRKLEDLRGLSIRVPQIPPIVDTWRTLGASPTPLDFTELFGALQQGIVDAQENPYALVFNASFFQVQRYLVPTAHGVPMRFLFVNEGVWEALAPDERALLSRLWREEAIKLAEVQIRREPEFLRKLRAEGMQVTQVDVGAFRRATRDVWRRYAADAWGPGTYEEIQRLR